MSKGKLWVFSYCLIVALTLLIAQWAGKAVTVIAENAPVSYSRYIVIDAGHGGIDGGAVSCSGIRESELNLQIALRLRDLFHLLGYPTRMLRETDVSLHTDAQTIAQKKVSDLKERLRIVSSIPNALLLSIHQNHFTDPQYSGAQVFYASTKGSGDLAKSIQPLLSGLSYSGKHRQPQESRGIYLMEHAPCPAVLIECGFLSNHREEALLRDSSYQKQLCSAIASGTISFITGA